MSSVQAMRGMLQTRLLTLGWADQTSFEKKAFTPTPEVPYQEVATVFGTPDPITLSHSDMHTGTFQVRLLYPLSQVTPNGAGVPTARAEAIAALFPRNLMLRSGAQVVKITRASRITNGEPQGDRDVTIVRVRFADR